MMLVLVQTVLTLLLIILWHWNWRCIHSGTRGGFKGTCSGKVLQLWWYWMVLTVCMKPGIVLFPTICHIKGLACSWHDLPRWQMLTKTDRKTSWRCWQCWRWWRWFCPCSGRGGGSPAWPITPLSPLPVHQCVKHTLDYNKIQCTNMQRKEKTRIQ